jgi:hypothetical protein
MTTSITTTTKQEWFVEVAEGLDRKEVWCDTYYETEGEALHVARKLQKNITNNYTLITVVAREVTTTLREVEVLAVTHDEE